MAERELDINEAILAELKSINKNLAHIRAAADRFLRKDRNREQALGDMMSNLPRLP